VFSSLKNSFIVEVFVKESLAQIKKENSTISIKVIEYNCAEKEMRFNFF
jgi:hypothetical protein